ncbi:MAG: tetratricopeptide repeat protein [Pirellulaceae bacterium]
MQTHPENAAAHAGLALALIRTGQFDPAAAEIDRAVQLNGQYSRLHLDLARALGLRGDHERALETVEKFLTTDPAPATAMRAFATFYLAALEKRQRHAERAEALMQQARELDAHVWTTLVPPPEVLFERL